MTTVRGWEGFTLCLQGQVRNKYNLPRERGCTRYD